LYKGEMTVEAAGLPATKVPVEVTVADWTVPAAHDWRTWVGMIQSPDSLSMEYEVPMWSEEHWKLIARSFHYMSELGCRIVYVPLLARTNFGNSESMVRWIDKGDGRYDYDFSIMDRYLDLAEECLGKPQIVTFQAWEVYLADKSDRSLSGQNREAAREIRAELKGKGPRVTVVDPKTGKAEMVYLPDYGTPQSKAQWQPLFDELHKRMASRGLEKTMMLGMVSDVMPPKEDVAFLNEVSGGLAWVSHAHPTRLLNKPAVGNGVMHKIADLGYEAHVYNLGYQVNPEKSRRYGWQRDTLVVRFARNGWPNSNSFLQLRLLPAFNITGEQRGIGRLGVDTWFIAKDRRGQRVGAAYDRYPEVKWRNLDIENWILAPAAGGPVATGRFENLREGLEECEARITIEGALTDPGKRKRLGDALAGECEKLLKERQRAMWQSIWSNDEELDAQNLVSARHPIEALWGAWTKQGKKLPGYWDGEARKMRDVEEDKGRARFAASPWRERNERLFTLAGQVERKLSGSAALGAASR
ncbi:MAG: hypothetical protein JXL80_05840, partial [Planctomycetes bacterium]|nr:hypothetical protein [Planctomycetota bacterium]